MNGYEACKKIKTLYEPCSSLIESGPLSQTLELLPVIIGVSSYSYHHVKD